MPFESSRFAMPSGASYWKWDSAKGLWLLQKSTSDTKRSVSAPPSKPGEYNGQVVAVPNEGRG